MSLVQDLRGICDATKNPPNLGPTRLIQRLRCSVHRSQISTLFIYYNIFVIVFTFFKIGGVSKS